MHHTSLFRCAILSLLFVILIDDRQITHLICARLKYDLFDFSRGVLGLLPAFSLPKNTPLGCVIAQAFCSQKSFREITLNYAKLP